MRCEMQRNYCNRQKSSAKYPPDGQRTIESNAQNGKGNGNGTEAEEVARGIITENYT